MKRNRTNIFAVIALGGLMACGPMARAQDSAAPATPPPTPGATNTAPPQGRAAGMQNALDKLGLTPDQKDKTMEVLKDQRAQMRALRADTTLSSDDQKAKRKEITEAIDAKLKAIFTPDQYTQWVASRKQMRNNRAAGGPGDQGAPAAPSSDAPKTGSNQN